MQVRKAASVAAFFILGLGLCRLVRCAYKIDYVNYTWCINVEKLILSTPALTNAARQQSLHRSDDKRL